MSQLRYFPQQFAATISQTLTVPVVYIYSEPHLARGRRRNRPNLAERGETAGRRGGARRVRSPPTIRCRRPLRNLE